MRINKLYKYEVCLSRSSERRTCHEHWPEGLPEALVMCVNKKSVVLGKEGGRASMVVISGFGEFGEASAQLFSGHNLALLCPITALQHCLQSSPSSHRNEALTTHALHCPSIARIDPLPTTPQCLLNPAPKPFSSTSEASASCRLSKQS
jgi:hypothetical protein